jgi:hypothetical protein
MTFKEFVEEISKKAGLTLPASWNGKTDVQLAKHFLESLNGYFFQTYEGIGTTSFDGEEFRYFSDFHKFWEAHHKEVLNVKVDRGNARLVAEGLQAAVKQYSSRILAITHQTHGLKPDDLAKVRFLTANQDFGVPPENQFTKYLEDETQFDPAIVVQDPEGFLSFMEITKQSQSDKRIDYARNAAAFLLRNKIPAFGIAALCGNDAVRIRDTIIGESNMGYGMKKTNMFIRDMFVWGVWPKLTNLDQIDVASDRNTMKVALRTKVLATDIPILSSFLDVFCHQYGLLDEHVARGWRVVWEEWRALPASDAPASPCLMDFILYRLGREYCGDILVRYRCEQGHEFFYFGGRLKNCRVCSERSTKTPASPICSMLPCQIEEQRLPRAKGKLALSDTNLLYTFDGKCPLECACKPRQADFRPFDPPKSISIKGRTGWTSAYAERGLGGGGLMS